MALSGNTGSWGSGTCVAWMRGLVPHAIHMIGGQDETDDNGIRSDHPRGGRRGSGTGRPTNHRTRRDFDVPPLRGQRRRHLQERHATVRRRHDRGARLPRLRRTREESEDDVVTENDDFLTAFVSGIDCGGDRQRHRYGRRHVHLAPSLQPARSPAPLAARRIGLSTPSLVMARHHPDRSGHEHQDLQRLAGSLHRHVP